jgi:hypothetical protein
MNRCAIATVLLVTCAHAAFAGERTNEPRISDLQVGSHCEVQLLEVQSTSRRSSTEYVGTVIDVTDERENALEQARARARLQELTDRIPGAIYRCRYTPGKGYTFDYVSDGFRVLAGLPADTDLSRLECWLQWVPESGVRPLLDSLEVSRENLTAWNCELPLDVPGLRLIGTAPEKAGVISFTPRRRSLSKSEMNVVSAIMRAGWIAVREWPALRQSSSSPLPGRVLTRCD